MKRFLVTALFSAAALSGCREPEPVVPPPDPGHTRLTNLGARAEDPMPCGDSIVFCLSRPGESCRLVSLGPRGDAITTWLEADADVRAPQLGRTGLVVSFASNRRGTWDIYTADADRASTPSSWRLLWGSDADETSPTCSPDGHEVAFASLDRRACEWRLKVIGDGGEPRDLGAGFAPCWHPSKNLLVCQRARPGGGPWSIVTVDVATGAATDVWPDPDRGGITPSWTRDGQWILFAATTPSGPDGLWAVSPDGVKRVRLSNGGVEEWSPREMAEGRIVYCRREGDAVDLWSFLSPLK